MDFITSGKAQAKKRRDLLRPGASFWAEKALRLVLRRLAVLAWDCLPLIFWVCLSHWLYTINPWALTAPILAIAVLLFFGFTSRGTLLLFAPIVGDFFRIRARIHSRRALKAGNDFLRATGVIRPDDPTKYRANLSTTADCTTFTLTKPIPGVSFDRLEAVAHDFATTFDSVRTVVTPLGSGAVRIDYHHTDPLAGMRDALDDCTLAPVVGRKEDGEDLVMDFLSASHTAIQGQTRSGKSVLCYVALSQLHGHPDAEIWGIDPNAVLLSPLSEHAPERFVLGSDPEKAEALLQSLVTLMDDRIKILTRDRIDKLENFSPDLPLIVLILEEFPALIRSAEMYDKPLKTSERITPKIRALVGRLVSESAKAGIRVVLITQRADADILDGASRAQMGQRISFGVDNADAVRMLHPAATPETALLTTTFRAGRCLTFQDRKEAIAQIDYIDYPTYLARIGGKK